MLFFNAESGLLADGFFFQMAEELFQHFWRLNMPKKTTYWMELVVVLDDLNELLHPFCAIENHPEPVVFVKTKMVTTQPTFFPGNCLTLRSNIVAPVGDHTGYLQNDDKTPTMHFTGG